MRSRTLFFDVYDHDISVRSAFDSDSIMIYAFRQSSQPTVTGLRTTMISRNRTRSTSRLSTGDDQGRPGLVELAPRWEPVDLPGEQLSPVMDGFLAGQ
jgi:hypothetical protein